MSWRNHRSHEEETKAVKQALKDAGYDQVRVGHGRGTAWAWLELRATIPKSADCACTPQNPIRCNRCQQLWEEHYRALHRIAREVTGRHGDHNGDTLVVVELI